LNSGLKLRYFGAVIKERVTELLAELPSHVVLVAAAKSRTPEEVLEAVEAGVSVIGENYVQEALAARAVVGQRAKWHFIGHLQTNKVKKAVEIFDLIETVDSAKLAQEIDKRSREQGKVMPVLIEVNSGREPQKFGVLPEEAEALIQELSRLPNLKVEGLMTMGPEAGDPEDSRPYFRLTRGVFERLKNLGLPNVSMTWLSMGMSHSYQVAIEEGANMVRIGTKIFGLRACALPRRGEPPERDSDR
jgi:pyridoxal phosphate enzyme (YggS family)